MCTKSEFHHRITQCAPQYQNDSFSIGTDFISTPLNHTEILKNSRTWKEAIEVSV